MTRKQQIPGQPRIDQGLNKCKEKSYYLMKIISQNRGCVKRIGNKTNSITILCQLSSLEVRFIGIDPAYFESETPSPIGLSGEMGGYHG